MGMLSEAATATAGSLHGKDREYRGVSTDTRSLERDQLFIALKGPNFDGHEYVAEAASAGAAGAVVDHPLAHDLVNHLAQIQVDDTRAALGRLSGDWRGKYSIPLIAVTGSNGKTTVKQMLYAIFSLAGKTHATRGNLNNDIGLPLTLLDIDASHQFVIAELGANHAGEIGYLTSIAQPDVALVTNAAAAHLEGFGSIEGVAHAKGEIFSGLSENGTAVINADDTYSALWRDLAGDRRVVSFGVDNVADISATDIRSDALGVEFQMHTPNGHAGVQLPVPGAHNVTNALAAAAAAYALELPLEMIVSGLTATQLVDGRMQRAAGRAGIGLVDDSYNANPLSFAAAIDYLASLDGSRWLVMGDMKELGENAPRQHAAIGHLAKDAGIDRLYCTGQLARHASDAFADNAEFDANIDNLIDRLRNEIDALAEPTGLTILVKASRSMRLERIVTALRNEGG